MPRRKQVKSAIAGASMVAALASPTFGLNISFNAAESSITFLHDAEDGDAGGASPTNFRTLAIPGSQIPFGSAPGYQLGNATVTQFGAATPQTTGTSAGKIGIGHFEDSRSTTMTVQSLSFVNQNEIATNPAFKMDGNSMLQTQFSMVWDITGTFGPNIVGRISVPIQAVVVGTGSARVQLTDIHWEADLANDVDAAGNPIGYFDTRTSFTGEKAFTSPGTFSTVLTSTSAVLKNQAGAGLTLQNGDKFRLSGTMTFLADGNSPADTQFQFGGLVDYEQSVLANNPLRYYRFEETSTTEQANDQGSHNQDGNYIGNVQVQQATASFQLGHGARFGTGPANSSNAIVHSGNAGLDFQNSPFTVEAWVARETAFGDGETRTIVDNQAASNGWRLAMNDYSIVLEGDTDLIVPFESTAGEFYHIVAVVDGLGGGQIFVNGISIGGGAYDLTSAGGGSFLIGASDPNSGRQFIGLIDEVAIYGTALIPGDIGQHYDRGHEDGELLPLLGIEIDPEFGAFEIPEPGTVTLTMVGLSAAAMIRRRREA